MDASNYAGIPRAMREALRALSREAPSIVEGNSSPEKKSPIGRKRSVNHRGETSYTLNLIRRSPHYRSTSNMVDYANNIGLKLSIKPKESRDRVARRLASLINGLPDYSKNLIIDDLLMQKNNQTQGWIDVIKNRN
jgi:hypothetical protein